MKFIRVICLFVALCLAFSVQLVMPAATQSGDVDANAANSCYSLDATIPYLGAGQLVDNADAAFVYEKSSNTLMHAWNPDMQVYPSSLVKVLTAYMAVESGNLSDQVTVTQEALENLPYDAVSAQLQVGETLSLGDLIYCMLVGSANDAASVIAIHISGSENAFVEQMNAFVAEIGCTGTVLKNPHGLHDPEQVSTVRDLARILCAATDNKIFQRFFATTEYTVPATNMSAERELVSNNFLMSEESMEIYYDERVTGGRTGIADDGSRCLATSAEANGLEIICIIMGARDTHTDSGSTLTYGGFKETSALLDLIVSGNKAVQILYPGQVLRQCSVINGDSDVVLGAATAISAILPEGVTQENLSFRYLDRQATVEAPIAIGQKLSDVEVYYGNMCIAKAELQAMNKVNSVADTELIVQTIKPQKITPTGVKIMYYILGLVGVAVIVVIGIRLYSQMRNKNKSESGRRHRTDRRRSQ